MATQQIEKTRKTHVNGLDTVGLRQLVAGVTREPGKGKVKFGVTTAWKGGALSETRVDGYFFGGNRVEKDFRILIDEPRELLGGNAHPNPQEMLMAAFNACMLVGYVAGAAVHGIELTRVEIETEGELDLRGFLGIDPTVKPGYDEIRYTVRIAGDGTPEQFEDIHQTVMATSPNRFNMANPIRLTAELVVE